MSATVTRLRPRPRPLRADVPPFDATNPVHLRAWENLWDFGRSQKVPGEAHSS